MAPRLAGKTLFWELGDKRNKKIIYSLDLKASEPS